MQINCPRCNTELIQNHKFCGICGFELSITEPDSLRDFENTLPSNLKFMCSNCNFPIMANATKCPKCLENFEKNEIFACVDCTKKFFTLIGGRCSDCSRKYLENSKYQNSYLARPLHSSEKHLITSVFILFIIIAVALAIIISRNSRQSVANLNITNDNSVDTNSTAYQQMYTFGQNVVIRSLASDTALEQCTSAKTYGMVRVRGIPTYLGVQAEQIQSLLKYDSGFQGCIDGFGGN